MMPPLKLLIKSLRPSVFPSQNSLKMYQRSNNKRDNYSPHFSDVRGADSQNCYNDQRSSITMVQWVGVHGKETSIMSESAKSRLGQQVGNYRLTAWLGQGGFADVYLGEHIYLKTQCALKMGHVPLSEDTFLKEARTISSLVNPNIERDYDYEVVVGHLYLIMSSTPTVSLHNHFPSR